MAKCMIGFRNRLAVSSFAASSEVTELGATNLANDQPGIPWQTAGELIAFFRADHLASTTWRVFYLGNTNLTTSATVRWRVGTIEGFGDVYDSGTISADVVVGYRQSLHVAPTSVVGRYLQCDIVDTSNPDGFLRIGIAYAGPVFEPERNYALGAADGVIDTSIVTRTRNGALYMDVGPQFRVMEFVLPALTLDERRGSIAEIDRVIGVRGNVLWIPNPSSVYVQSEIILGRLISLDQTAHPKSQLFSRRFSIEERL